MSEVKADHLLRLYARVLAELKYIDERLVEGNSPKINLMLTIMKKRITRIMEDAEKNELNLSFKRETDEMENA